LCIDMVCGAIQIPLMLFELLCLIILSVGTLSISWEIFETLFFA
jgi:hypothetical protein